MAAIDATFVGEFYDKITRTYYKSATMVGQFFLSNVGIGGGPVFPPEGGGGSPPGIWGPTDPRPTPPIAFPPGWVGGVPPGGGGPGDPPHIWGPTDPRPSPPIYLPPEQVPPNMKPPQPPPAGTTAPVPGNWPTSGMVPPEYVVFNYPGVGPIYVAPPPHVEPAG